MKELLARAEEKGVAIGAFSVGNMEMVMGAVKAAEELETPIILQIAEVRLKSSPLELMGPMMISAAENANVDIAVHLDHGLNVKTVEQALDIGFTSVMLDGSLLPIEENIKTVKGVVETAKEYGATVEAELGVVGGNEGEGKSHKILCTNPDDAKRFCDETGVDALAVAIGNAHGNYPVLPELRFDVLEEIHKKVNTPLVLHGGTGISDEQFQRAISLGVRKINIATASFDSLASYAKTYCNNKEKANYFELSACEVEGVYQNVKRHIKSFQYGIIKETIMKYIEFDSSKKYDLILLGRIAVDLNPVDYYCPLNESTTFKRYLGGSPANIAVGLARLGKKCGFFARVSDDQLGTFVTDFFEKEGIDTSRVKRCENGEKIGLTFTEIKSETESSIVMYRNDAADLKLEVSDIDEEYIKQGKALLISGTALCESPSREAALKAVMLAKRNCIPIIFDIDYRAYNWKNDDEISIYYSAVAREADIILGSREEYDLTEKLIKQGMSDEETAKYWHSQNAKIVVIKHGKEGSTAYTNDGESYNIKPFPVKLLKSFGGGDGYASAFLYGLFEGYDIIDALEFGSASAAMLVASHACSQDMPSVEAVKEFIKKEKEEYGEMIARV